MSEWQPIEKADKNGDSIIGCIAGNYCSYESWWNGTDWVIAVGVSGKYVESPWFPTHWMPLPAPPQGEQTDEG